MASNTSTRHNGRVKKWFAGKGFGFVARKDERDLFVHVSALSSDLRRLADGGQLEGTEVTFTVTKTPKGLAAEAVLTLKKYKEREKKAAEKAAFDALPETYEWAADGGRPYRWMVKGGKRIDGLPIEPAEALAAGCPLEVIEAAAAQKDEAEASKARREAVLNRLAEQLLTGVYSQYDLLTPLVSERGFPQREARDEAKRYASEVLGASPWVVNQAAWRAAEAFWLKQLQALLATPEPFRAWLEEQPADRTVGSADWGGWSGYVGGSFSGRSPGADTGGWAPNPLDRFVWSRFGITDESLINVHEDVVVVKREGQDRFPLPDWAQQFMLALRQVPEDRYRGRRLLPAQALNLLAGKEVE